MTSSQQEQLLRHQKGRKKEPKHVFRTNLSCLLSDLTLNDDHDGHVNSKIIVTGALIH